MASARKGKKQFASSSNPSDPVDKFILALAKKGLRLTLERQKLVDEILSLRTHFDADELYLKLKQKGISLSRDTVYRTLPILLECGLIQKSVGDERREYFERTDAKGHHDHMVCIRCRKVIEFLSPALEKLQEKLCEKNKFVLVFHDHRLFGYCENCR